MNVTNERTALNEHETNETASLFPSASQDFSSPELQPDRNFASASQEGRIAVPLEASPDTLALITTFRRTGPTNSVPHVVVKGIKVDSQLKPVNGSDYRTRRFEIAASGHTVGIAAHHAAAAQYVREQFPGEDLKFFSVAQRGDTTYHYSLAGACYLDPQLVDGNLRTLDRTERVSATKRRMLQAKKRKGNELLVPDEYVNSPLAELYYSRREQLAYYGYPIITWEQFHKDYIRVRNGGASAYPTPEDGDNPHERDNGPDLRHMCSGELWSSIAEHNKRFEVTSAPVQEPLAPVKIEVIKPSGIEVVNPEPVGWGAMFESDPADLPLQHHDPD